MNKKIIKLFDRYQSGQATEQEKELVEKWYEIYSQNNSTEIDERKKRRIYKELEVGLESFLPARVVKFHSFKRLIKVATMLVVMLSVTMIAYNYRDSIFKPEVTYQLTVTSPGIKKEVLLPDQSVIYLNAASSLSVPSDFGDKKREVILIGEAFFKIHKDPSHPFIIHSGKILTTVLGTSFNIKAYEEDKNVEISVATGKVKVELHNKNGQLIQLANSMIHNQQLLFDKQLNRYLIKVINNLLFNLISFD